VRAQNCVKNLSILITIEEKKFLALLLDKREINGEKKEGDTIYLLSFRRMG